jgi:hypothetical protein
MWGNTSTPQYTFVASLINVLSILLLHEHESRSLTKRELYELEVITSYVCEQSAHDNIRK